MSKMEQGQAPATLNSQAKEMEKNMRDMVSEVLTRFRLEGKLCDVVIKVDDVEFKAHKIILCSCSPYFCALFTGAWATSNKKIYTIPGVSPEMMDLIINYAYTFSVPVTRDNVVEVLAAADQFLVSGMVQTCCFFLEDQLCLKNCIGIWRLLDFYHCPELKDKAFSYILYNFKEIARVSLELQDLSVQQLTTIIESDHLNAKESMVFEAIISWINCRPEQRRDHISVLLSKVRLGLMTFDYFKGTVVLNAVVKNSIECKPIIQEVVRECYDFRTTRPSKSLYRNRWTRPRLPPDILLVTGGKDFSIAATNLEVYDARGDCWATVNAEICRAHHGAAVVNGFVYLIGGCSNETNLNTVQRFDIVTSTWQQVASMNFRRCFVSVAVHNGCIYAMGGFNGQSCLHTVECYKPETDWWTMMAPMHAQRSGAGAATLRGKVYICGGFNGLLSLSTAECYNPDTNQWTMIAPMRRCRRGLGVVAYRDCIYAVGGTQFQTSHLRSVEAYNPEINMWSCKLPMKSPRSYFGIEVINDELFVVGGYNGSSTMETVERYDEDIHMWHSASDTEMSRSGLTCSVLHGVHSVAEKLFPRDAPQCGGNPVLTCHPSWHQN